MLNQLLQNGSSKISNVIGNAGNNIDFSWTWKENIKNANAEFAKQYTSRRLSGFKPRCIHDGKIASSVVNKLNNKIWQTIINRGTLKLFETREI